MVIMVPLISGLLLLIFGAIISSPDAPFPQGDEIMHIRSIRESLQMGSYWIPSLSGMPNPYKPPLLFWLGMVSDQIFGVGYAPERLVSLVFGLGSLFLLYRLAYLIRNSKIEAAITAILFGFSFLSLKFFGLLMMEGLMAFFVLFYFYHFYLYRKTKRKVYLILGSFVSGIGYLLKGPILHVYLFLFIISYFYVKVIRFRKGKININWKHILKEKFIILSFGFTILVPVIWILFLYFYVPSGKDLLRFFFITENVGKFYSANQPGIRIWFGWILYTIPFTIPIFHMVWNSVFQKNQIKHQIYVQTILVFLILVTSLHLLPNRKDPYYVTPFISFLFLLPLMNRMSWESYLSTKTNRFSILIVYFVLVIIAILLRLPQLFVVSLFGTVIAGSSFSLNHNNTRSFWMIILTQIAIIPILIFFLLRPMSDPNLPEQTLEANQENICVVAENPWTAMDVQNKLESAKIQFSLPLTIEENCNHTNYLINYTSKEVPQGYIMVNSWYHWTQHLQMDVPTLFNSILKMDLSKFKTKISLWKRGVGI